MNGTECHVMLVRCISWKAILWEYFYYREEVPYSDWPLKDKESYFLVRPTIGASAVERLQREFLAARHG
ncbi:MAG TPA: hypothetical protein VNM22_18115 [Candidatus Limnocylindrales bacterium]|nr:hypothetical protein [Candidatus Limnocylindrales bacterium]